MLWTFCYYRYLHVIKFQKCLKSTVFSHKKLSSFWLMCTVQLLYIPAMAFFKHQIFLKYCSWSNMKSFFLCMNGFMACPFKADLFCKPHCTKDLWIDWKLFIYWLKFQISISYRFNQNTYYNDSTKIRFQPNWDMLFS